MELRSQLQNISKGKLSFSQYIGKAKNIGDHLRAASEPVESKDSLLYVLSALGSSYNSFVASVNMRRLDLIQVFYKPS